MSDAWLDENLENAQAFSSVPIEDALIAKLLDTVDHAGLSEQDRPVALGAAFDLLVSAEYYGLVAHIGWLYCAFPDPLLIYPYTNTCPRCIFQGDFVFHRANKPRSGAIGATTSRLLGRFIDILLKRNGVQIEILRGREPVDIIFIDRFTKPVTLFFAEIKASPLLTLPLAVHTQTMLNEPDGANVSFSHRETDLPMLFDSELYVLLSGDDVYSLGSKHGADDIHWAYRGLSDLLEHDRFFPAYLAVWKAAFDAYQNRSTQSAVYWLTNGCGQPVPRPENWPRRSGTGYESISDSKTSVGMDRTDDIKKATYQVLKLGAEGKPSQSYHYKTGIISNIHAVRHFDAYLDAVKDIVWTRETTGEITRADELSPDAEIFNLFDGIVTLTSTLARDTWVKKVFRL